MITKYCDKKLVWISLITGTKTENLAHLRSIPVWNSEIYRHLRTGKEISIDNEGIKSNGASYPDRGYGSLAYHSFIAGMANPIRKTLPSSLMARANGTNEQAEKYFRLGQHAENHK